MKSLKALLAVAAVAVAFSGVANAQGRSFSYSATPVDSVGPVSVPSGANTTVGTFDAQTTAEVVPYFYAVGAIGGTFQVTGWGAGTSSGVSQLDVYHNQSFISNFAGFGDLQGPGGQKIEHTMQETAKDADGNTIYTGPTQPAASFNSPPPLGPGQPALTKGHLIDFWTHNITVGPEDGPGTYADNGVVTFIVQ